MFQGPTVGAANAERKSRVDRVAETANGRQSQRSGTATTKLKYGWVCDRWT